MNAVDFHERIATAFNDKYRSSKAFQERFHVWTALFEKYINATDRVLDLGCGTGVFSNYLANRGHHVIGVDGSAAMIAICQQNRPSGYVQYFVNTLPFIDPVPYREQDVVLMSSFLEYVVDASAALQQAHKLLRPNGLLIVSIPNQKSIYRMIERLLYSLLKRPAYFKHSQYAATEAAFNQQLSVLGFDVLETIFYSGQDPVSRCLTRWLPKPYVNTLLVGVYRKNSQL